MARIYFHRLEKRKGTQTLMNLTALSGLTGLEENLASSIETQTRSLSQLYYPFDTFYSPFSPYSSYLTPWSPLGSYYYPWTSSWSSWYSPWSTWTSPWLPWTSPWSPLGTPWPPSLVAWPSTTDPSIIPGTITPYPPGTLYGLVKRSNLKA